MESDELRARQGVAFVGRRHHREIQRGPGSDLTIRIRRDEAKQRDGAVLLSVAEERRHPGEQLLTAGHGSHPDVSPVELEQLEDHLAVEGRAVALQRLFQDEFRLGEIQAGPLGLSREEPQRFLDVAFQACAHTGAVSHSSINVRRHIH